MGAEKRRYRRLETDLEARLKNLSDPDGAAIAVRIVNLGPEGAFVSTDETFVPVQSQVPLVDPTWLTVPPPDTTDIVTLSSTSANTPVFETAVNSGEVTEALSADTVGATSVNDTPKVTGVAAVELSKSWVIEIVTL